jgi:hypothetical protein
LVWWPGSTARIAKGGELHLVELKTRGYFAAHASDAIELSVQRLVLQEATGERVSSVAYVAVKQHGEGQPRPIRVGPVR